MSRALLALAPLLALGCTTLAGGDHLDPSLRGDPRIVGGQDAPTDMFPYQVSLQTRSGMHYCGGSVIDDEWILTAAHCVEGSWPGDIRVESGITHLSDAGEKRRVDEIVVHPDYDSWSQDNDIALLRLARPISAPPVALLDASAEPSLAAAGTLATVSGWGTLRSGGTSPDALQYVDVPVVDQGECEALYGRGDITDGMICAGDTVNGGIDSCQGDSGGPLVVSDGTQWVQAGVVSWGYGCADADYPGVYARVSHFRDFVLANVPDAAFITDDAEPTEPTVSDLVLDPGPGRAKAELSAWLGAGEVHVYTVQIDGAPGELVDFKARTLGSTDTFGSLYDADGAYLTHDDDGGRDYNFQLGAELAPGAYLLVVEGYDAAVTGDYELKAIADRL